MKEFAYGLDFGTSKTALSRAKCDGALPSAEDVRLEPQRGQARMASCLLVDATNSSAAAVGANAEDEFHLSMGERATATYRLATNFKPHIHNDPHVGCKTLFATHYHEMTVLADELPRAVNYRVAVSEDGHDVVFLHRIVPGGADRSYGVHVARLAGMPQPVVARAWDLLGELEKSVRSSGQKRQGRAAAPPSYFHSSVPLVPSLAAK